ncbi:hypothetical protein TeGR_g9307 [Tetraparma gracilis]|uniref:Uncharacterized protein n=1 Tax=Tetraparma gracilis TaxID=2962635 RepID=A0ABQ6MEB9_9STRA|nr:hypothetical protein TeGR_g9307 [Tetraparma gracilis]
MPPKSGVSPKNKKKGAPKGNKKSKKVVPVEHPVPNPAPAPAPAPAPPPPEDPWKAIKSPYGGAMSPSDAFNYLFSDYPAKRLVSIDAADLEQGQSLEQKLEALTLAAAAAEQAAAEQAAAEQAASETTETAASEAVAVVAAEQAASETTETAASEAVAVVAAEQAASETTETAALEAVARSPSPSTPPPPPDRLVLSNHDFSSSPPLLLPNTINKLVSLTIISSSLSSAPLQSLLSSSPHFLRVLDVTNNALSSVPDLSSAKKLLSLNLSHNPISASPSSPCLPPFPQTLAMCLRCLDLENCGLNSIVDGLAPLKQLRSLNIACNELTTDEMKRVQAAPFSSRLEEFSLHPMPSLTACPDYKEVMSLLLKKMSCLKALDGLPFSQQVAVDIDKLASLDLHSGDDDNVKDSSSCSCVEGNACISRYNCSPHIWHRRFEVAKLAREGGEAFPREKYLTGEL